ncbi:hypothetical protein EV702DRAFT_614323 [Suillus placidus]|uniref:Uncharacterized protein n=1 Tax=Suillus placidus TaxID=48579 RepID=A0A9P7CZ36_9AGAM|nr:hypothetical protein EV702DRAFT_614323 [Suillus placidus]
MNPPESKNKQIPWSFNHRTRAHDASDDSESEAETNSKVNIPSDDTRLVQEFDISSRHETVEYKPNPWSIARINAASRPLNNLKEPPGQAISEDIRQKSQPRAPQGRIVDAFKVQAERKPPRASRPLKALKVNPRSNTPQVSREHQIYSQIQGISSAEPGDRLQHDNPSFLPRGPQTRSSDTPTILSSNAPQGDLNDLRLQPYSGVPTLSCTPDSKRRNIQMTHEALLQRSVAHISTPDMSRMPQSQYNAPFMSMSSPLTSRDYPVNASRLRPGGYQSSPPRPFHRNISTPRLLPCNQSPSHFRRGVRLTGNREYLGTLA